MRHFDKIVFNGRPKNPLFCPAAQVLGNHRQHESRLEHEVAIATNVDAICCYRFESELLGGHVAIDR